MSVVCFDLIPESLEISDIPKTVIGIVLGIFIMIYCDIVVQKRFNSTAAKKMQNNNLLKTGIIVSIGLAIHNIPEGLAIGSGFEASIKLGIGLAIAICLHDIPERNKHGSTNEKWRNEKIQNFIICNFIWYHNWNWSSNWSNSRFNINICNSYLPKLCSWSNALYCVTEN